MYSILIIITVLLIVNKFLHNSPRELRHTTPKLGSFGLDHMCGMTNPITVKLWYSWPGAPLKPLPGIEPAGTTCTCSVYASHDWRLTMFFLVSLFCESEAEIITHILDSL